jgi:hypothetical protein
VAARALTWPGQAGPPPADPLAGRRFQGVLAQLLLREGGLSSRHDPLVLTASEVNAFLAGHVDVRDSPVWPVWVRLRAGEVDLGGATTLGMLAAVGLGTRPEGLLPGRVGAHPVWIGISGRIAIRSGRAEVVVRRATIGRQRVPVTLLWRLLGGRPPALTWRMPRVVDRVDVEEGRLVIHTRRGRAGVGPG